MTKEQEKTNVMRLIEQAGIPYTPRYFACEGAVSGVEAAALMGEDPSHVFKTLVTVGKSGAHYVFVIPAAQELDLKKVARCVGEKAMEMIKSKELLPLTGYIHGGCSPIGMKKPFQTVLHEDAQLFDTIIFSAGRIGCQVELAPDALSKLIPFSYSDITVQG